jgi:hypothetical protein
MNILEVFLLGVRPVQLLRWVLTDLQLVSVGDPVDNLFDDLDACIAVDIADSLADHLVDKVVHDLVDNLVDKTLV